MSAEWIAFPGHFRVTFDRQLLAGPLDPANWQVWLDDNRRMFGQAIAIANRVDLTLPFVGIADLAPDRVRYTPPPFDVVAATPPHPPTVAFTLPY